MRIALAQINPTVGDLRLNVRKHLEDTFGQFELTQTPEPEPGVVEDVQVVRRVGVGEAQRVVGGNQ